MRRPNPAKSETNLLPLLLFDFPLAREEKIPSTHSTAKTVNPTLVQLRNGPYESGLILVILVRAPNRMLNSIMMMPMDTIWPT
jgi:hypothetical protein